MPESRPGHAVGPWRRRSPSPTVYANPWIEVFHDEVDRPDGSPGIYGVVHFRSAAVGVVAVGDDGRLLLVGQHRYSLDEYSWEIPEGGVRRRARPWSTARGGSCARRPASRPTDWRGLCRMHGVQLRHGRAGRDLRGHGPAARVSRPRRRPRTWSLRWATLDEVLAEIDAGEIHDLITIAGVCRYALEVAGAR